MNKIIYDITNIFVILLAAIGLYLHYGLDIALIGSSLIIFLMNLISIMLAKN